MATKDSDSSSKQKSFHNALSTNQNGQYSNLNLNQNFKCDNFKLSKSASKSSNDGRNDYAFFDFKGFVDSKNSVSTFSKRSSSIELKKRDISKSIKTLSLDNSQGEDQWNWKSKKEAKNSAVNSSTLSLHIAAYENSVEAAADASDIDNELDNFKLKKSMKSTNVKLSAAAAAPISTFQDQFEFPRQQNQNNQVPMVMQFQASQQLLRLGQNDKRDTAEQKGKLHRLLEKVEPLSEKYQREELDIDEFKAQLNAHNVQLGYQPNKVYVAWRQYVRKVQIRFNKNNEILSDVDKRVANVERKFDPTFCVQMPSTQDRENGQESTSEIHQNGRAQQQHPEEGASMQRGVANAIQNELRGPDVLESEAIAVRPTFRPVFEDELVAAPISGNGEDRSEACKSTRKRGRTPGYSPSPKPVKKRSRPAAISQPNNGTGISKRAKEILKRSRTPATISQRQQRQRHRTPFQEQPQERQIGNRVSARQQQLNQQRSAFVDQDIPDVSISSQSVANLNQTDQIVEPQQQQPRPVINVEQQQPQAAALADQTFQQPAPNVESEHPLQNVAPPVNSLATAVQIPASAPLQQLDQQQAASVQLDTQNGLIQQQQQAAANSNETDQHRVLAEPPPQQLRPVINVEQQQSQAAALAAQTLQQPASNAEVQPPLQNIAPPVNQMAPALQIPAAATLGIELAPQLVQLLGQLTASYNNLLSTCNSWKQ